MKLLPMTYEDSWIWSGLPHKRFGAEGLGLTRWKQWYGPNVVSDRLDAAAMLEAQQRKDLAALPDRDGYPFDIRGRTWRVRNRTWPKITAPT